MRDVFASDVMSTPLIAVNADASIFSISKIMLNKDVSSVLVSDGETYVGIITKLDLVRSISEGQDSKNTKANSIMSSPLKKVDVSTPIMDVAKKMAQYKVKRLIVTDKHGMVGIVSVRDITNIAPELIELVQEEARMGVK